MTNLALLLSGLTVLAVSALGRSGASLGSQAGDPRPTCMLIDLDADGISFQPLASGVRFDLDGDGTLEPVGWTTAGANDAFLALDVNKNGRIDNGTELIGNRFPVRGRPMPTGLRALILLQDGINLGANDTPVQPFPKGAGQIDKDDPVYADLRLWIDGNHDGRSAASELSSLSQLAVSYIRTGGRGPLTGLNDNGTETFFQGSAMLSKRGVDFLRPVVEVRLAR